MLSFSNWVRQVYYSPFFPHVLEAWAKKDHPNVLSLFYEDMKRVMSNATFVVSCSRTHNRISTELNPRTCALKWRRFAASSAKSWRSNSCSYSSSIWVSTTSSKSKKWTSTITGKAEYFTKTAASSVKVPMLLPVGFIETPDSILKWILVLIHFRQNGRLEELLQPRT